MGKNNSEKITILQALNDLFSYFSKNKTNLTKFKFLFDNKKEFVLEFNINETLPNYDNEKEYNEIKTSFVANNLIFIESENIDYTSTINNVVNNYFYNRIDMTTN
ncbi:hypothetical protein [Mesoplasma melaleucae]|uniref:Uncharacterized protein n=1 Tax=Mesoplasma melaleucae TaxID=81459 RepID=A0A2K8NWN3_9MOLU|nr:hypothetical protein [Mesoplasma melaleucae]ATZ18144.1 hypothetical protein EMELA_v1c06370 [Mesoplasma melaleucae]